MKFTADTHFGSQRALELSNRPYSSVEEMNKDLIKRWNNNIAKDEDVYHLGDFGDYNVLKYLNGNIHLILGNYEKKDITEGKITIQGLLDIGFASVDEYLYIDNFNPQLPEIKKIKLIHEPSKSDIDNPEVFNLFGHIHGRQLCKKFGLDVGVDGHHMNPIDSEKIIFYSTAIKKYYDAEVFI